MEPKQFLNHTICQVIGVREVKGNKFGIELELEGRGVGLNDIATRGWGRHHDGSLRGESVEYATQGSADFDESQKRVTELFKKFKDNKVKFNDSIRTSTHVHLNFSDKRVKDMINFFALFTMLEEVLQYYSGEDRKGNLFCISTREAEGIMGVLFDGVAKGDLSRFAGDRYKYAACNLSSLYKFGTVEVRTMKGATSAEQVNTWLSILNDMYNYALTKMKSPVDLAVDLSHLGADGMLRKIFNPENYRELINYFPKIATLHYSLMEGIRIIQVFGYNFEADFIADVPVPKGDGRLPKRIAFGPNRGGAYVVYRPDGMRWVCEHANGNPFWEDGEACGDDPNLFWSEIRQRFIFRDRAGVEHECHWRVHHAIRDEGPHGELVRGRRVGLARVAIPAQPIPWQPDVQEVEEEPDVEEDHWEPDFDDEGDEI